MELYLIGKSMSGRKGWMAHFLARWCKYKMNSQYGCYLSFKSRISKDCRFPHPIGIVIGDDAVVEEGCQIYQCVTLGAANQHATNAIRYPHLKSGVTVYAGAKIIGGIVVHRNAIIGANAVVLKNIPENAVAAGVPAPVVNVKSELIK